VRLGFLIYIPWNNIGRNADTKETVYAMRKKASQKRNNEGLGNDEKNL
jgi:hypothetical protein